MLHIVLLILKIAGLIILSLLTLILCLLFVIIFASFRYTIDASINNSIKSLNVKIRFNWLMHLVSGRIKWENGSLSWYMRGAWKTYQNDENRGDHTEKPDSVDRYTPRSEKKNETLSSEQSSKTENTAKYRHEKPLQRPVKKETNVGKQGKKKRSFFKKAESICERIKYTFQRFCDKIQTMKNKKKKITAFLDNELHKRAFVRLLSETKKLLKRLYPDAGNGNITFGFEDPSHTGYTLAGLSLIYPVTEGNINLYPDFDHKILKGNIRISGKIRIFYALLFMLNMISDRNVRITYRHIKKFKW